uniref:Uncharacterized protein n=1 Tax=Pyrodinium bahamense TaxID=73915 RepID=A0A7S0A798_9DINO|mmetsp:Transcript_24826/g.68160  ORF Transcript_24826/g.68160 Transcript_24826/m.68160 type:complete len:118 (+) Transcript_24826:1119-1472(+)
MAAVTTANACVLLVANYIEANFFVINGHVPCIQTELSPSKKERHRALAVRWRALLRPLPPEPQNQVVCDWFPAPCTVVLEQCIGKRLPRGQWNWLPAFSILCPGLDPAEIEAQCSGQ